MLPTICRLKPGPVVSLLQMTLNMVYVPCLSHWRETNIGPPINFPSGFPSLIFLNTLSILRVQVFSPLPTKVEQSCPLSLICTGGVSGYTVTPLCHHSWILRVRSVKWNLLPSDSSVKGKEPRYMECLLFWMLYVCVQCSFHFIKG